MKDNMMWTTEGQFEKIKLYEVYDENGEADFTLELWGSSTKYPDVKRCFSSWADKSEYLTTLDQLFQWCLFVASQLSWPAHAEKLVEFAMAHYTEWQEY